MSDMAEIISSQLGVYDGSADPEDLNSAQRRVFLLGVGRQIIDYMCRIKPWVDLMKLGTLTVTAGQLSVAYPTDFQEFSRFGGLFDPTDQGNKMSEVDPLTLMSLRQHVLANGNRNDQRVFSRYDEAIQLPFTTTANRTYYAFYRKRLAGIADNSTALPGIIDRNCDAVLRPGMRLLGQSSKSDDRPLWTQQFNAGIKQMEEVENFMKTTIRKLPTRYRGLY